MAVRFKITHKTSPKEVATTLKRRLELYQKGLELEMWRALTIIEAAMVDNIRKKLTVRTGRLMNSVSESKHVVRLPTGVTGTIGSEEVYAATHEYGAVIYPKLAKYLKFPTEENRNLDGSAMVKSESLVKPALIPLKKGGYLVVDKASDLAAFILKPSVTIPERSWARPAIKETKDRILKKFGRFVVTSMRSG